MIASPYRSLGVPSIAPSPDNPRTHMDPARLQELAQSIAAQGLLEPVIVRPSEAADPPETQQKPWVLIAGHRRLAAHALLDLPQITALVHEDLTRQTALPLTLVENLQREDLGPLEEAAGYRDTLAATGYTQAQLGAKIGKSQAAIGNALRLLTLPAVVKDLLDAGTLSAGHGRALSQKRLTASPEAQVELAAMAAENGWAVRALENITDAEIRVLTGVDISREIPAAPLAPVHPTETDIRIESREDGLFLATTLLPEAAKTSPEAPQRAENAPEPLNMPTNTTSAATGAVTIVSSDTQLAARAARRQHLAWCKDLADRALDKLSTVRKLGPAEITLIVGALSRSRGRLPSAWGEPAVIHDTSPAMLRLGLLTAAILADLKAQRKDPDPALCYTSWWLDGNEPRSERTSHTDD